MKQRNRPRIMRGVHRYQLARRGFVAALFLALCMGSMAHAHEVSGEHECGFMEGDSGVWHCSHPEPVIAVNCLDACKASACGVEIVTSETGCGSVACTATPYLHHCLLRCGAATEPYCTQ